LQNAPHIIVLDDDPDILTAARLVFQSAGLEATTLSDPEEIEPVLNARAVDAVILDLNFEIGDSSCEAGLKLIEALSHNHPDLATLAVTAHGDIAVAVEAIKLGATDFIAKPWENEKLLASANTAVALTRARREASALRTKTKGLSDSTISYHTNLIGSSPAIQQVHDLIRRAAPSDTNVLILGENGTGKEVVAREIHRQSNRSEDVFLPVDMGAIADNLFESELFGHKKGAFTDARNDRIGRFEAASGGTLFLDEIGNLPQHLQPKLLSALERREIIPIGEVKARPIDVRLISATNMPRNRLFDDDVFRQDLLYRINTVEIHIAPLRERRDDVPQLLEYFLELYARKWGQARRRVTNVAMDKLVAYDWPGNVRALRHSIERALILSDQKTLGPDDFLLTSPKSTTSSMDGANQTSMNLEEIERDTIDRALRAYAGNISKAAEELGLTRASLYRRMAKHGLS